MPKRSRYPGNYHIDVRATVDDSEEPGTGANQAPRQMGPDTGADQNGVVGLPMMGESPDTNGPVIRVTIEQDM